MTRYPTHFYSDPHYGHANIITHSNRPFGDVADMNRQLEARYAAAVGRDDVVLWCGDCAWSGYDLAALLARLPGRKWLVRGNHDRSAAHMAGLGFDLVTDRLHLHINGLPVTVSHFPPRRSRYSGAQYDGKFDAISPDQPHGGFVIHGHTHEHTMRPADGARRVHVGVDACDYAPVPYARVAALISLA